MKKIEIANACIPMRDLVKISEANNYYAKHLQSNAKTVHDYTIDILYTLDSASNYSAIQKLKP